MNQRQQTELLTEVVCDYFRQKKFIPSVEDRIGGGQCTDIAVRTKEGGPRAIVIELDSRPDRSNANEFRTSCISDPPLLFTQLLFEKAANSSIRSFCDPIRKILYSEIPEFFEEIKIPPPDPGAGEAALREKYVSQIHGVFEGFVNRMFQPPPMESQVDAQRPYLPLLRHGSTRFSLYRAESRANHIYEWRKRLGKPLQECDRALALLFFSTARLQEISGDWDRARNSLLRLGEFDAFLSERELSFRNSMLRSTSIADYADPKCDSFFSLAGVSDVKARSRLLWRRALHLGCIGRHSEAMDLLEEYEGMATEKLQLSNVYLVRSILELRLGNWDQAWRTATSYEKLVRILFDAGGDDAFLCDLLSGAYLLCFAAYEWKRGDHPKIMEIEKCFHDLDALRAAAYLGCNSAGIKEVAGVLPLGLRFSPLDTTIPLSVAANAINCYFAERTIAITVKLRELAC